MSVDFNAEFALTVARASAQDWIRRFESPGPATTQLIGRWRQRWSVQTWSAEPDAELPNFIKVLGPGGFAIDISEVAANVYHSSRFTLFVHDPEHQRQLRQSCLEWTRIFGSDRAIYVPELTPTRFYDGATLDQIEAKLRETYGPPAAAISQIAEPFQPGCYFVDRFEDLRSRESRPNAT